jgi:hypothetical protein
MHKNSRKTVEKRIKTHQNASKRIKTVEKRINTHQKSRKFAALPTCFDGNVKCRHFTVQSYFIRAPQGRTWPPGAKFVP